MTTATLVRQFNLSLAVDLIVDHGPDEMFRFECRAGCDVHVRQPYNLNVAREFATHQARALLDAGMRLNHSRDTDLDVATRVLLEHRWNGRHAYVTEQPAWVSQWCKTNCHIEIRCDHEPTTEQQAWHQARELEAAGFRFA